MASGGSRILDLAGDGPNAASPRDCLFWFRLFVLAHVAVRTFYTLTPIAAPEGPWYGWLSQFLVLCCLGGLIPIYSQTATRFAVAVVGLQAAMTLPLTANHVFLEFVILAVLALLDEKDEKEAALLLRTLRWITVIFFFYSGLQKVLYGRYFDGQFLAWVTAVEDRFAPVFRPLMSAAEFERIRGLGEPRIGSGPYRVDSVTFLIMSNAVYVFEMVVPILMLLRKTRVVATLVAMVFIVLIEAGARELIFGVLMLNLLLLFLGGRWSRRAFPLFMLFYAYLILARFDVVPMFEFQI